MSKCPTMTRGEPLASDNPAASAASLGHGAKRSAEEALCSSNVVKAQRPRVDVDEIVDGYDEDGYELEGYELDGYELLGYHADG